MSLKKCKIDHISQARTIRADAIGACGRESDTLQAKQRKVIEETKPRIDELAKLTKAHQRDDEFLQTAQFVLSAVPESLSKLYKKVISLKRKCARTDITVAEASATKTKLTLATNALQEHCAHPFVIRVNGYYDQWGDDIRGDNSHRGESACVICRLNKHDEDCTDTNLTFPNDGTRVIHRVCDDYDDWTAYKAECDGAKLQ